MKIDLSKISALAKSGHNPCLGKGTVGREVRTGHLIICHCVWRALKAKGVYPRDTSAVRKAIGEEEGAPCTAA